MKGHFHSIMKNDGFIMLQVLFTIALLFILVTSSIASYRNEVYITKRQIEQVKIETLFQTAQTKYKQTLSESGPPLSPVSYNFPDGTVDISVSDYTEHYVKLQFLITFHDKESDAYFSINHLLVR
ncbi:hypothetical protein [Oceanobacillus sp. FSL H7-0719]|uniref:hypothetical protein n=1 Tax=Oceanobacillus sp. FSL H7-0719 TaxID=2954507 RepID=UPI00324C7B2B